MKARSIFVLGLALVASGWLAAWAQVAPARPPLPNFDKRTLGGAARASSFAPVPGGLVPADAAQAQALSTLYQRVPGIAIGRDTLLNAPRHIVADDGFLTGPGGQGRALSATAIAAFPRTDQHRVVKAFLNEHAGLFGHNADALASARITRDYVAAHSGLRTVIWQQEFQGVPVFAALLKGHITANEELASLSSQFVPDAGRSAAKAAPHWANLLSRPPFSPEMAIARAAANVGTTLEATAVSALGAADGLELRQEFQAPGLKGSSYTELTWLPLDRDSMRLCWQVILVSRARAEMYRSLVDAETGEVLVRHNLTRYQAPPQAIPGTYRVFTSDSPSPFSPGHPQPLSAQPPIVPRTLLQNLTSLSAVGSPAGWLDPANPAGQFRTMGNNVDAHTDLDDDDRPDLPRPWSNATPPVFDFPLDLAIAPMASTNASVVNLFYWNNYMHDRLYDLGFTEAAGNFQNNNFGRGGRGGDAIQADALDGAALNDPFHVNNANFYPPPDGFPGRMQMYVFDGPQPDRDGSLDAEIVCHEYVHGLSDRLVGGGVGIYALQTAGMGEGWSDFYPLCILSETTDDPHACYAVGGYATFMFFDMTENYYFGIRRYPYSTDMMKNPLTFKDIDPTRADPHLGIPISPWLEAFGVAPEEVHNQGEVWCVALWEVRANLVDTLGWDEGNHTALQLVTDGMKLCPPNPTFLEARDGILLADQIAYGGANRNEIWLGFAKRGMGFSAKAPPSDTTIGVVEAFDVPDDVVIAPPDGIFEISFIPSNNSTLQAGVTAPVFVRVRDGAGVTNATVRGTVDGVLPIAYANAGVFPDARAGDSIYSAEVTPALTATNLTITVAITAPGKIPSTNTVNYFVATRPPNDLFANATKVKAEGSFIASNNRYADPNLEPAEPRHANVATAGSSLWWAWTPTSNTPALVDTGGSKFSTVLGVYTGTNLTSLKEVGSAQTSPQNRQSYVQFTAKKGETYYVAVAGSSTNATGQIALRILPGANPDLTAPLLTVSQPVNGLIINQNTVDVVASAVDPEPGSSGVDRINFGVSPRQFGAVMSVVPSATGTTNRLALTTGRNTITVTATDGVGNTSDPVQITVTYRRLPVPNDQFALATELVGDSGSVSVNNLEATKEVGEPEHADNPGGRSVWYWWRAAADGTLLVSTENSSFDTLLGVYTGTRVDQLTTIAANDDAFDGSRFSKSQFAVRAGQQYYIAIDGFNAASGVIQLAYTFTPMKVYVLTVEQSAGGRIRERTPGAYPVPADSTETLTALPDAHFEFAGWEGDVISPSNPVAFAVRRNLTVRAVFRPRFYADDFETGNLSKLAWIGAGAKGWTVTDSTAAAGKFSARSGAITHAQTSSLSLTAAFYGGDASFDLRLSSEPTWDALSFLVDGVLVQKWSGDIAWGTYGFRLAAGTHTLEWRYTKDNQNSLGLDAAFIDNVNLPIQPAIDASSAARLMLVRRPQGQVELRVQGKTNQVYIIQTTTTSPPTLRSNWVPYSTNAASYGEIRLTVDPQASTDPQRFFRAIPR
ncbi:MAG: hypothetical protein FJ387_00545 [Verrucomicrobia bacterium]|nr:hypothetical protein [Verrucomicrobiota bacterium]